jgi:ankyrin repeat protein
MAILVELPPELLLLVALDLPLPALNAFLRCNRQLCNLLSPSLYKRAVLNPEIPLSYAILNNQQSTLELLLSVGGTALLEAPLPRYPLPLQWPRVSGGPTPLYAAAASDRPALARLLLDRGATANPPCGFNAYTPLHIAAIRGSTEMTEVLLDGGADIESGDGAIRRPTPLYTAALFGHIDVARILLEHGAKTETTCSQDEATPLAFAAKRADSELVTLLLQFGADTKARDWKGRSVLHLAVMTGEPDIVKILLENGADPEATMVHASRSVTPLEYFRMVVPEERRERAEEISALFEPSEVVEDDAVEELCAMAMGGNIKGDEEEES